MSFSTVLAWFHRSLPALGSIFFVVKYGCAQKEEAKEVHGYQRRKSRLPRGAGHASAGEACGEQETCQEGQAQTQPGEAFGRR